MFFLNKTKVAVHDGRFHADDIFSVAILSLYLNKSLKIFRTRDEKILAKMDYILDVGGEYKPEENKFDHHQEGWNEKRENGIPYATSGLLWKEYGEKITGSKEVADRIDEKIIQSIDADDSGVEIYKNIFEGISPYCLSDYISAFNLTWTEKNNSQKVFEKIVELVKNILKREIKKAQNSILSEKRIKEIYEKTEDKRILILDDNCSWRKNIDSYSELLFVIHPKSDSSMWSIDTITKPNERFKRKMYFSKSWAGKRDEELAKITGVSDAVFCHNDLFIAVTKSKEGAIQFAELAMEENKIIPK